MSEPLQKVIALFQDEPKLALTMATGLLMIVVVFMCMTMAGGASGGGGKKKKKKRKKGAGGGGGAPSHGSGSNGSNGGNGGKKKKKKKAAAPAPPAKPPPPPPPPQQQQSKKQAKKAAAAVAAAAGGKKKKKSKNKNKGKAAAAAAAPVPAPAPADSGSDSDVDADGSTTTKKKNSNRNNPSRKMTAAEKIRKKMAAAASRQASGEAGAASDDGWSTASSKKKSRNANGGGSKQGGGGYQNSASSAAADAAGATSSVEMKCMVESRKLGNIIGPKGATMHAIQDATGATIDTPRRTGGADGAKPARSAPGATTTVTITGTREACQKAKKAIKELCSKGYSTLLNAGGDFTEAAMSIPSGAIPEIFGAGGQVIRKIQDGCEVRIHVPEQRDGADRSETRRITIAGPKVGAARARQVIDSIVRFHHHPSTHPGIVHVKIPMTSPSDVGTIIGRGGSQIKHIQGTTKTRVYTPKNAAIDALEVMVVGPQKGVDVAQRMILKILEDNAEIVKNMASGAASGGGGAAGAGAGGATDPDDPWGEAEEEEDLWAMAPKPSSTMSIDIPAK
jgi:predicted RNA-binding protein YlqC (UPF0109 family)